MKDVKIFDIVFYFLVIFVICCVMCFLGIETEKQDAENEEWLEVVAECQHEYVITSKYNFLVGRYKTISKCTKCGYEVE